MTDFQKWDLAIRGVSTAIAIAGAIGGLIAYFLHRAAERKLRTEELLWRKTHFIYQLSDSFERDVRYQRVLGLLELPEGQRSPITRALGSPLRALRGKTLRTRQDLDRFLDFFDRQAHYVLNTKALDPKDLVSFGWCLDRIQENPDIRRFAENEGYNDVLKLAKAVYEASSGDDQNGQVAE